MNYGTYVTLLNQVIYTYEFNITSTETCASKQQAKYKNLKHGSFKVQVLGGTLVGCSPVFPPEWRNISSEMFPWPACKQKVTDLSIIKSLLPDDLPKVTKN